MLLLTAIIVVTLAVAGVVLADSRRLVVRKQARDPRVPSS